MRGRRRLRGGAGEGGLALIAVLMVVAVAGLLIAASVGLIGQAGRAERYTAVHTQALYNARMGVDTVLYFLSAEEPTIFGGSGPSAAQSQIASDLASLNDPPFAVTVAIGAVSSSTNASGATVETAPVSIHSVGTAEAGSASARVTLTIQAAVTSTASGTSGSGTGSSSGSTQSESGSITLSGGSLGTGPNISLSGSGVSVSYSGSSSANGSVTVTSSGASVSMPNLTTVDTTYGTSSRPINGNAWIEGSGNTIDSTIDGTAVITGSSNTVNRPINGEAIVTGSSTTLNQPVNGPLLMTGSGGTINGTLNCGGVITGDNETITGTVNGLLVLAGSDDTVGSAGKHTVLNSGVILIGDSNSLYANVSPITMTVNGQSESLAIVAAGQSETVTGVVNGNVAEYNHDLTINGTLNGTASSISSTETFGVNTSCPGDLAITVQPTQTSSGQSGLAYVTLSFGSTSVSG